MTEAFEFLALMRDALIVLLLILICAYIVEDKL